ncbi:MAG: hypothetical protein ABJL55_05460 [Roseibium sp.]
MKHIVVALSSLIGSAGIAVAHPSLQGHPHPHTDAASYFTIETLVIFAVGLSIGGTVAWYRRRKGGEK